MATFPHSSDSQGRLRPRRHAAAMATAAWLLALPALGADDAGRQPPAATPDASATRAANAGDEKPAPRFREGTSLIDCVGVFKPTGDRLTFFAREGRRRFVVLENLSLERIYRVMADNRTQLQWTVNGTVTEFRGVNYLLVQRATYGSLRATDQESGSFAQAEAATEADARTRPNASPGQPPAAPGK